MRQPTVMLRNFSTRIVHACVKKMLKVLTNIIEIMLSQMFWRLIFGKISANIWLSRIYFGCEYIFGGYSEYSVCVSPLYISFCVVS